MDKVNLIIFAMDEELASLLDRLHTYQVWHDDNYEVTNYYFKHNNEEYIVFKGKIGKVATALNIGLLSKTFEIKHIYNLGTSGAYSNELEICDVVIATEVKYFDVNATAFNYKIGQVPGMPESYICDKKILENREVKSDKYNIHFGLVGSSDSFITKENIDDFYINEINPLCVEMESGAVGQVAYMLNIPFTVIRSISDKVYIDNNASTSDENLVKASDNCVDTLLKLINY